MKSLEIVQGTSEPPAPSASGGGNGNGTELRLRVVEDRLTKLETHMEYVATKKDIESIKVWVLGSVLGAIPVTVGLIKILFFSG